MPSANTSFRNGVASLALTRCSRGHAGTYTCTAENAAGKQSSSAELHMTGKAGIKCCDLKQQKKKILNSEHPQKTH